MITVTHKGHVTDRRFPTLRVLKDTGHAQVPLIVLFSGDRIGTVVQGPVLGPLQIGYYSNSWNADEFQDYKGSVTITED